MSGGKITLGSLVDRLSILNLKIYAVQDWVYECAKDPLDVFKGRDQAEVHANLKKLAALNLDRNETMTSIDVALDEAIKAGKAPIDARYKLT